MRLPTWSFPVLGKISSGRLSKPTIRSSDLTISSKERGTGLLSTYSGRRVLVSTTFVVCDSMSDLGIYLGKTFSAEATSEHVKRPLYVIGGGDLGTSASSLDIALERVFDVATAWKAIVLIDEVG